jgi:hypothetical protein
MRAAALGALCRLLDAAVKRRARSIKEPRPATLQLLGRVPSFGQSQMTGWLK